MTRLSNQRFANRSLGTPSLASRRAFLGVVAGAGVSLSTGARAAEPPLLGRLIRESRAYPEISQRIAFISKALLGKPYRAHTLIGGPRHAERFVVRDDVFDCVTFCEVVLAAALARDFAAFEASLRQIRYEHGQVSWRERNHYFAEWSRRAVENGICTPVEMQPSQPVEKLVNWSNQGRRRVRMVAIPRATLVASRGNLAAGDIVGFLSKRANLDFYHTGLIAFGPKGEWLLRHASQSRRRVLDEPMEAFLAANGVRHVTLLRPIDKA